MTPKEAKRKRKEQEKELLKRQKQDLERSEREELDQMNNKQENTKSEEAGIGLMNPNNINNKESFSEEPSSYFHSAGQHTESSLENFQTKIIEDYKPKDMPQIPSELGAMAHFEMPGENNPPKPIHNPFNLPVKYAFFKIVWCSMIFFIHLVD